MANWLISCEVHSLLQCVLAPAGDLLPLFCFDTAVLAELLLLSPCWCKQQGVPHHLGRSPCPLLHRGPPSMGRSLHRAHSLRAEPASATSPGCPHVLLLCLPIHLPLCETSGRRWTLNRFCLPFSLPGPFESVSREGSRRVIVWDGDDDVQLENSFAALSAVQDCEISA